MISIKVRKLLVVFTLLILLSSLSFPLFPKVATAEPDPTVYVVFNVDTEAANNYNDFDGQGLGNGTAYDPNPTANMWIFDRTNPWGPFSDVFLDDSLRFALPDVDGNAFKMTWYAQMDYAVSQSNLVWADGSPTGFSGYTAIRDLLVSEWGDKLAQYGDAIAYHHHFWIYDGVWQQYDFGPDEGYPGYQEIGLDQMVLYENYYPASWRSGVWIMPAALSSWLDQWMPLDYTPYDYTGLDLPFHPTNPTGGRWQVPTMLIGWIELNYNGYGSYVTDCFNEAESSGKAIASFVTHSWSDMPAEIRYVQGLLADQQAAHPDVDIKYVTAQEAVQEYFGWTDDTAPTFTITPNGQSYTVTSSEPLWANNAYVAVKYSDGSYYHVPANLAGVNTWTVDVPDAVYDETNVATNARATNLPVAAVSAQTYQYTYEPEYAVDGVDSIPLGKQYDPGYYWASSSADYGKVPQWLQIDLGSQKAIGSVRTHFWDYDGRSYSYYINVSNDTLDWTTQVVAPKTASGVVVDTFSPVEARYVRITVTGNTANDWAHIIEISVRTPAGVSASSTDGEHKPELAIDGKELTSNYWGTNGAVTDLPQWLQVDLQSPISISKITTHFLDPDVRNYTYHIEASNDPTFATNTTVVPSKSGSGVVTDTFAETTARYVRITVTGSTAGDSAEIEEFRIYHVNSATPVTVLKIGVGASDLYGNTGTEVLSFGGTQHSLTVTSDHDSPSPTVGVHSYDDGSSVTASVSSPVTEGSLLWTCTGWTGTGSVPASGSGTTAIFTITADSSITWHWASTNLYTITVTQSDNGTISPDTDSYPEGTSQDEVVTPDSGYHIESITVDGGPVTVTDPAGQTVSFTDIDADHEITATFAINPYTITVTQSAHGTISPPTDSYAPGASQDEVVTPDSGHHIESITVDGGPVTVTDPAGQTVSFTDIDADHEITATFAINTYLVTVNVGSNGQSNLASQTVDWGTPLGFVFTPDLGYHVADVIVNGTDHLGSVTTYDVTITGDTTVDVSFAINQFTITVTAGPNGGITPGTGSVNYGDTPTYVITPAVGYHIDTITVNGSPVTVTNPDGQSYQFDPVTDDGSISATFAINTYTITVTSAYGDPTPSASVDWGTDFTASVTSPEVVVVNEHRFVCVGYSVDGGAVEAGTSYTFTNVQAAHTITFSWVEQFYITVDNGGHGSPSQGSQWVDRGSSFSTSVTSPADVVADVSQWVTAQDTLSIGDVQAAQTLTFVWTLQWYVTVVSDHGTPSVGSSWVNAGGSFSTSVTSPVADGGVVYVCTGFTGSGSAPASGSETSVTFDVNSASSVTWNWAVDVAPSTTATVTSGTPGTNGWYVSSSVTVGLEAIDPIPGSGVKEIHYILDGGIEQVVSGSTASVVITGEGTHDLAYWAVDNGGNVESQNSLQIKIDSVAPAVTITAPSNGAYYKSANVPAAAYSVTEINPYGVVESGYSTDEGVHTYTVTVTDDAGNVGSASVTYTVDDTAPVVTITAPVDGAYYKGVDVPVGAYLVTEINPYTVVESGWVNSPDGIYTYTVTVTDSAGNQGSASVTYTVDDTAPVVTITAPVDGAFYKSTAVPAGAYSVTEINPYTVVETGYSVAEGVQTYTVTVTDSAGNQGSASVTYTVDDTAPVVTITAPAEGVYYKSTDVPLGAYTVTEANPYTVVESGWANSPDGTYTYTVTVTDSAGNVGSASVTYTVDDTAPVVTITAPVDGAYYKSANVPVGVYSVTETNPYTVVESGWTNSPDGTYTYTVTVTDSAGNQGSASVTYTVDDTAPVVAITTPTDGAYYKGVDVPVGAYTVTELNPYTVVESGYSTDEGVQTYTVTVTDSAGNVGSASVTYTVDDTAPVVTITAPTNGAYYKSTDVPIGAYTVTEINPYTLVESGWANSPEGTYTYTVTVTDSAGNVGSASVTYTVDDTAPVVAISAPVEGAYYKGADVPLGAYTVTESNPYTVVESGWINSPDGVYTYTVTVTDSAGNVGSASVTYTVDDTAPVVTITAPVDGAYYKSANVPLGVYSVAEINPYTVVETGYSVVEGVQTYTVTVTDSAGNVGSASVTYTVDDTAPVVAITAPVNGAYYKSSDVPGGAYTVTETNPYTAVESGWTNSPDGVYTYTVTVTDSAGNVGSASVTYTVDDTAPVVTITAPTNGAYYKSADVPVGAYTVTEVNPYTVVESGWANSPDGTYTYTVTVTDGAGNVGSASLTYTVDDTAPVVTITAPANGAYYKGEAVPTGAFTVTEINPYTVDESGWANSPDGAYTYTVTVTDSAGNVGSASVTYTVDDTAPVVTITAPADGAYYKSTAVPAGAYTVTETNPHTVVESGYSVAEGVQTYTVTVTDSAGNVGSASVTYTVDDTAPVVTITAPLNGAYYKGVNVPAGAYTVDELNPYTVVESGFSTDEGIQTYVVTVTDSAGNVGSASVTYTVDDTAPVVTITAPTNGGYYKDADVPSGAYTVTEINPYTVVESGWTNNPDGVYTYTVTVTDSAGNQGSASVTYTVDDTAPIVTITAPSDGAHYKGEDVPTGAFTATDLNGVVSTTESGWFNSPDGSYTYTVTATDAAGNVGSASVTYMVDDTAPVVTITAPLDGHFYKTANVPAGAYTVIDASPYTAVESGWANSPEGSVTYTVTVTDAAGNVGSASATYTVDNTAPQVTITAPSNGAYYKTANVPVGAYSVVEINPYTTVESGYSTAEGVQTYTVTVTDAAGNAGSASVTYTVDNTAPVVVISAPVNGAYYVSSTVPDAAFSLTEINPVSFVQTGYSTTEGVHTYTVTATDAAGNVGSASVTYTVDNTAPAVTITAPLNGHYYKTTDVPTGAFSATDLNGVVSTTESGWANSPEGSYTYTVTATDAAGNVGSASVTYTVDDTAPVVSITAPVDGAYYKGVNVPAGAYSVTEINPYTVVESGFSTDEGVQTYIVTVTDSAGNVGSASVTYTVDDTAPVVTITAPSDGAFYQTSDVPASAYSVVDVNSYSVVESGYSTAEGTQTYTVTATDAAGNVGQASVTYTVDNTSPVVTITAPLDGHYYKSANVPSGAYTVTEINPYTVVESGYSVAEGVQTYTVTVTDSAGNVGSASVTYTVDDTAPVVVITAPVDGAYYKGAAVPTGAYSVTEINPYTVVESGYSTDEGVQIYTVTVTDAAGNVGSASVTYTVDDTAPVVTITAPSDGAYYKSADVPVGAYSVVEINPYTVVESGWASSPEGSATYTVTVTDSAGNVGSASVTYTIDNTAPVVTINSPTDGQYYKTQDVPAGDFSVVEINPYTTVQAGYSTAEGVHTYTVTVTDSAGNVGSASVTYIVDNTAPVVTITAPLNGGFYKSADVPAGAFNVVELNPYTAVESGWTNSPDGVYTYTVTVTDSAGNVGSASVTYTVDDTAPVVTITAPVNGAYYKGAAVPAVAFTVDELNPYSAVESGYSVAEGVQTYTVTVTDAAGNVGSASVTYTVDDTAPVVTITAPVDGAYYKGVDVPVGAYSVVELNPYTVFESGYSVAEGIQTYTVTVTDSAGNVGSASVTYTVDDTAPVVTITAPIDGAYYKSVNVPARAYSVTEINPYTVVESGYSTDEGVQTYIVTVTDAAGNVGSASVTYTVDNTAPVVTINTPVDGAYYKTVNVPAADFSVVELNPYTSVESGYSTSEGVQTYTVTVTDSAGNVGSASVTYTVDNTAPVVTITAPLDGHYYKTANVPVGAYTVDEANPYTVQESGWANSPEGSVTYTVTVTDAAGNVGSASVTYTVDNTAPQVTITAPSNGAYYKSVNVPTGAYYVVEINPYTSVESGYSTSEGVHTYTVTVTDGAGNVGSASVTYTVDNTAPVVTITAPSDGAYYKSADVPAGAFNVVEINPYSSVESGWANSPDGSHTYTVTATDAAGNVGSASVTYTVDNIAPVVTITAPLDGAYYKTANVPAGAYSVVEINPYTVEQSGWANTPEGSKTYTVTVTDAAGNVGSASVTYTVDNTAPVVSISAPVNGAYYKGAAVPVGAYSVVELNPYSAVESGWANSPDGTHTYTVTVTDSAGNVGSASVTYTVDDTAPVVTITAPVDGAYYKSVGVPAGAYSVTEINPYSIVESGYSVAEGVHTYTVTVTDAAGNLGSASVTYTVDDTAPVVTITAPLDGGVYLSSTVPAKAFSVVDANSVTVVESGYSTAPGVHTYTVTATDAAGNVGTDSVTYDVQVTLTVSSAHGFPTPGVGLHMYDVGTSVTVSVPSPVAEGSFIWTCTGWTGTGSVPSSGSGSSVTFTISESSTITWHWQSAPASEAKFDFGTSSSVVDTGYTRVSSSTAYSASIGYGWSSTTGLDSRDRGAPDSLRRDFVFSSTEHTFNVDLPNGIYLVAVVIGDQSFMHDKIDVYAEGTLAINDLTIPAGSFKEVYFRVTVADGQLNLRILDDGGSDGNWVLDALTVEVASPLPTEASFDFGTSGSSVQAGYTQVVSSTAYSALTGYGWSSTAGLDSRDRGAPDSLRRDFVFSSTEHTFNVDLANGDYLVTVIIGDQGFIHDQINVYAEGTLVINHLTVVGGSFREVSFRVTVTDERLNLRILDDGGSDGNWVLDALTVEVASPLPTEASFDFGTSGSSVQAGYTQVVSSTAYSALTGYGWSSTVGLDSRDRGSPDSLRCDFVFSSTEHTFNVDLANGDTYLVTVVIGDQSFMHDKIDVYAEGKLVINDLTALPGSFQEVTFAVIVTDQQLNLRFVDDGGADANWVISALTVRS